MGVTCTARLIDRDGAAEVEILHTLTDGDFLRIGTIAVEGGGSKRRIDDALREKGWRRRGDWEDGDAGRTTAVERMYGWPIDIVDEDAKEELRDAISEADPVWTYPIANGLDEHRVYELEFYGWVSYIDSPNLTKYCVHDSKEEAIAYLEQCIGSLLTCYLDQEHSVAMGGRCVMWGEIDGTWFVVRSHDVRRDRNPHHEWAEFDGKEDAELQAAAWMDECAAAFDREDRIQRIAAALCRRVAAQIRERWATQELGDAVRDAYEAGDIGRDGEMTVTDLADRLHVGREYLYRVLKGEEWNYLDDEGEY